MNKFRLQGLLASALCALGVLGASVCERGDVTIAPEGIRCARSGTRVFEDSFASAATWPRRVNYENRLKLEFGHDWRGGKCLLVSGDQTPQCDTAWNVMTACRKLSARGRHYRLSFRVATTSAIKVGGSEGDSWWTAVHWYSADGSQTNVHRVCWNAVPGQFNEVVQEGELPAGTGAYAVQIGFDVPNVCEGRHLELGNVRLTVFDDVPNYECRGWFCSDAHEVGAVDWKAAVPAGCAVRFQCATADTLEAVGNAPFRGPDGTAATFWERPFTPHGKWMRYRVELVSDGRTTPVLKSVKVGGCVDDSWTGVGDGRPPRVKLLVPSPTRDARVPLKLSIVDESAVAWNTLKVSVDGSDATARFRRRENELELTGQTEPWTNGLHRVDVEVADWHGNQIRSGKRFFIGDAPKTPRITLRDDGMTLIDGEPFFPVGVYGVMRRSFNAYNFDRAFADLKQGGFNFAHSYSSPHDDDFLDSAWRHGLRVWNVARFPDSRFIEVERHHPAIIAWYLGDDTSANTTPEQLLDYDEAVKAVDPTRITTQADGVGAGGDTSNYRPFVAGTDNFLAEIYPVHFTNQEDRTKCVARVIRDMKQVWSDVKSAGGCGPRSCWPIIQYFKGWGWQRFPYRDELNAMSFASIIHGGQGITWYTYGGTVDPERKKFNYGVTTSFERWTNITNLATRISSLIPVLVERTGAQPPEPEVVKGPKLDACGNASVSALLKRHAGKAYLLTVNSTPEAVTAKFRLANVAEDGEVLWEGRKVKCPAGMLTDRFDPFAVHVYVLPESNAGATK